MKRQPIPTVEVLEWLHEHHPTLHANAEIERSWLWLVCDLRGDHNKPVRESIKLAGFRFAKRGHVLPSGKLGNWAHPCDKPIPFYRKGNKPTTNQPEPMADADVLAFAGVF